MSPATSFPTPAGYQDLVNQSAFNMLQGSRHAWEGSAGGLAWIFATAGIILLVPIIIWQRSQNAGAAAIGELMVTAGMHYYGLLHPLVWFPSYVMVVILLAISLYSAVRKRTD